MEILNYIALAVFCVMIIFPVIYIFYKDGNNKVFFLSACFGVSSIITILLGVITLPIIILLTKVIPELHLYGLTNNILPLMSLSDFVMENYNYILYPVLSMALPFLIYRRYSIFHSRLIEQDAQ